jgi:nanoRNase/pAp phosphatase (c-di-AMP/oligoRNAs hydrolase)
MRDTPGVSMAALTNGQVAGDGADRTSRPEPLVEITGRDITTNLPYVAGAHLVFDHHVSETLRNERHANHIIDPDAPSAARVVHRHYGGAATFPRISDELMAAVDKADAARYTVDEILALPDVAERVELNHAQSTQFVAQLRRCARTHGDVVVVDLRGEDVIHAGNRFMVYALFPQATVSVHVLWGRQRQNTVLAAGTSIIDRSAAVNIGELMLAFGGGGHRNAGTCQVAHDDADRDLTTIVDAANAAGRVPVAAATA